MGKVEIKNTDLLSLAHQRDFGQLVYKINTVKDHEESKETCCHLIPRKKPLFAWKEKGFVSLCEPTELQEL